MRTSQDRTAFLRTSHHSSPATEAKRLPGIFGPLCRSALAAFAVTIGVLVASIAGQKMPGTWSVQTSLSRVRRLVRLLQNWPSRLVIRDGLVAGSSDGWE